MNRLTWIAIGALIIVSAVLRHHLLFLIGIILALLAAVSAVWARYCLHGVSYRRHFSARRLFFGDDMEMRIEVVNAKPIPLAWFRADDEIPAVLTDEAASGATGRRRLVNVLSLRWYELVTRRYQMHGGQRGVWRFGPAQLRSGDLFGFDIRRAAMERNDYILVYPKVVPIVELGLPARHPFGEEKSNLRIFEDPMRLMGAREYSSGDSFRFVHWKATARRQALQTKVFEPSSTRPVAIFLNVSTHEFYNEGQDWELMEYAICAAASVGKYVWENGYAVGLYANAWLAHVDQATDDAETEGDAKKLRSGRVRIMPRRHPSQLTHMLEALARINERGRWSLEVLLELESRDLPFGATLVVISAVVNRRLQLALADLRRKGFGVTLITLGEEEPQLLLPGVTTYHIGGKERWQGLTQLM